jgi:hypothetical protein
MQGWELHDEWGPLKPEIERYVLVEAIQKPSSCSLKFSLAGKVAAQKVQK